LRYVSAFGTWRNVGQRMPPGNHDRSGAMPARLIVASDIPWYAPCSEITSVPPVTRMASLTAASIASPPPATIATFARPNETVPARRAQYSTTGALSCRMFVVGSFAICSPTAAATRGLAWPTMAGPAEPDIVSRYSRPWLSHSRALSARSKIRQRSRRSECRTKSCDA
jgi:hypothetical protein